MMLEQVNNGDQAALKAFLQTYAKHIFDRAKAKSPNEDIAREATRITVMNIKQAAQAGRVPPEPAPWIDRLTDESVQRLILPLGTARKSPSLAAQPPKTMPPQTVQAQKSISPVQSVYIPQNAQNTYVPPVQRTVQNAQAASNYVPRAAAPRAEEQRIYANQVPQQPQAPRPEARQLPPRQAPAQRLPENQTMQQAQPIRRQSTHSVQEERKRAARAAGDSAEKTPSLFGEEAVEYEADEMDIGRKKKKREDASVGMVFLIFLLVTVVLGLIWMLLVMLMSKGYLPVMDFGFAQWFNTNVFQLF